MARPDLMTQPMRDELVRVGFQELRTAEQVDAELQNAGGTLLVAVNSVCGCAAGRMRPAVKQALLHAPRPDQLRTVFAGQDLEATARAREYFTGYPPSSPSVALLKDGELVFMLERRDIEGRTPDQIARDLVRAFDQHCSDHRSGTTEPR